MHSRDEIDKQQDQAGADEGIYEADQRVGELVGQLHPMVAEPAALDDGCAVEMGDVVCGEEAGEEIADQAAEAVDAEDVEARWRWLERCAGRLWGGGG